MIHNLLSAKKSYCEISFFTIAGFACPADEVSDALHRHDDVIAFLRIKSVSRADFSAANKV